MIALEPQRRMRLSSWLRSKAGAILSRLLRSHITERFVSPLFIIISQRGGLCKSYRVIKRVEAWGLNLILDPHEMIDRAYMFGIYNQASINFLIKTILNHNVNYFVDAGSNLGLYSLAVTGQCKGVRSISIEPDPYSQNKIIQNIQINKELVQDRITVLPCALDIEQRKVTLQVNDSGNRGGSSICLAQNHWANGQVLELEVETVAFKDLAKNFLNKSRWVLKLDIEGYEYPILHSIFNDCYPESWPIAIVTEWTGEGITGPNCQTPIDLIKANGYSIIDIEGGSNYMFVKPLHQH